MLIIATQAMTFFDSPFMQSSYASKTDVIRIPFSRTLVRHFIKRLTFLLIELKDKHYQFHHINNVRTYNWNIRACYLPIMPINNVLYINVVMIFNYKDNYFNLFVIIFLVLKLCWSWAEELITWLVSGDILCMVPYIYI